MLPCSVHLDNFDISHLSKVYSARSPAFALPLHLRGCGVEFKISPTVFKETASRSKGKAGTKNAGPAIRVMEKLRITSHDAPHKVISCELFEFVDTDSATLAEFEKEHLKREVAGFLDREILNVDVTDTAKMCKALGAVWRMSPVELENYTNLISSLQDDYLKDIAAPHGTDERTYSLVEAIVSLESTFTPNKSLFEAALLSYTKEGDANRLLGTLALKRRLSSKQPAITKFQSPGEDRYRQILNGMLKGWGYTLKTEMPLKDIAVKLPALRSFAAYWGKRNPGQDLSMNNLCDAAQLLYLPASDFFSLDVKVFNDLRHAVPTVYAQRLHPKGTFWHELAERFDFIGDFQDLTNAYGAPRAAPQRAKRAIGP